jgi:hypothetical protein
MPRKAEMTMPWPELIRLLDLNPAEVDLPRRQVERTKLEKWAADLRDLRELAGMGYHYARAHLDEGMQMYLEDKHPWLSVEAAKIQTPSAASRPSPVPTVGRIVFYTNLGGADGRFPSEQQAAIVTGAGYQDGRADLCIIYRTGLFFMAEVPYAAAFLRGHWSWPPRGEK